MRDGPGGLRPETGVREIATGGGEHREDGEEGRFASHGNATLLAQSVVGMKTYGEPQVFLIEPQKSEHARLEVLSTEISMWPYLLL